MVKPMAVQSGLMGLVKYGTYVSSNQSLAFVTERGQSIAQMFGTSQTPR
jgi:hypothetical protein